MRILAIAVILAACGGAKSPPADPRETPSPAAAAQFPAARWLPAKPTYVLASPTVREAQRAIRDAVESLGVIGDADVADASRALHQLLAVDPLSAEPVNAMGIDLGGGIALFSEGIDPTIVVHLSAPDATLAFFDQQRDHGLVTQSEIVEGDELFTAKLTNDVHVSWVIDHDWLWVHFRLIGADTGTTWFTHSRHPATAGWVDALSWAGKLAAHGAGLVGFVELRDLLAMVATRAPAAVACVKLVEPIGRVGVTFEGDGNHVGARLTVDIGGASRGVTANILPLPPGWSAAAAPAALAAQWNVDLDAAARWLAPCASVVGVDLGAFASYGVRSARAMVLTIDPSSDWGSGAVALDLRNRSLLGNLLDQIPLRSHLESDRKFGAYVGHRISIPFKGTIDYVLDDHVGIVALGEGLLDKIAMGAAGSATPIFAIDVAPPVMPEAAWTWLLDRAGITHAGRTAARLLRWRDAHVALTVDQDALVLAVTGDRQ